VRGHVVRWLGRFVLRRLGRLSQAVIIVWSLRSFLGAGFGRLLAGRSSRANDDNSVTNDEKASKETRMTHKAPVVGIIMGSKSDAPTLRHAWETLEKLDVPYEKRVVSAHRMPDHMFRYAEEAESRGLRVIIAGAGGAAHLPGMIAAKTLIPVLGVPILSHALHGVDSLLSIVQMPGGIPVGTLAIGDAGAKNAALLAAQILALHDPALRDKLQQFRADQTRMALESEV